MFNWILGQLRKAVGRSFLEGRSYVRGRAFELESSVPHKANQSKSRPDLI